MSSLRFLCQIYEMSRVLFCNTLVYIILLHCVTSHSYSDKRINLLEGSMIHRYQSENPNPNLVLSFHFQVGKSNKIIQSCAKVKKGTKWMMTSLLDAWLYFRGSWGDCLWFGRLGQWKMRTALPVDRQMHPIERRQRWVVLQLSQKGKMIRRDVRVRAARDVVVPQPLSFQRTQSSQNAHVGLREENVINHTLEKKRTLLFFFIY